jgi:hypothetical protein
MIVETRKLIRKIALLAVLLACLGVVSSGAATNASNDTSFKPCCSVCEPDPTIPICRFGCIEGCRS